MVAPYPANQLVVALFFQPPSVAEAGNRCYVLPLGDLVRWPDQLMKKLDCIGKLVQYMMKSPPFILEILSLQFQAVQQGLGLDNLLITWHSTGA